MTRDQIYTLIGPPHFSEGFSVRTWNYLFHFRVPRESAAFNERSSVVTCQVKINFSNGRIGSMQDSPAGCIERAVRPAPPVLPVQPPPQPVLMQRTLSADALFLFDRWDLDSVNRAQGIKQLSAMADQIGAMHSVDHIDVLGYTDRIGTLQWNMLLSQRRAETIKNFLVTHGVPAAKITARGMGLTQPGTPCPPTARDELIRCLAPDRHVDVRVYGMQKERPDLGVGGN
jgi:outer membrane protein OmpA-like peptidoglycan-associated protein